MKGSKAKGLYQSKELEVIYFHNGPASQVIHMQLQQCVKCLDGTYSVLNNNNKEQHKVHVSFNHLFLLSQVMIIHTFEK